MERTSRKRRIRGCRIVPFNQAEFVYGVYLVKCPRETCGKRFIIIDYCDDPDVVCPYCSFFSNHIYKFDPEAELVWSMDPERLKREKELERES